MKSEEQAKTEFTVGGVFVLLVLLFGVIPELLGCSAEGHLLTHGEENK